MINNSWKTQSRGRLLGVPIFELFIYAAIIGTLIAVDVNMRTNMNRLDATYRLKSLLQSEAVDLFLHNHSKSGGYPNLIYCSSTQIYLKKCVSGQTSPYIYTVNNVSNPKTFCLATKDADGITYRITSKELLEDQGSDSSMRNYIISDSAPTVGTCEGL